MSPYKCLTCYPGDALRSPWAEKSDLDVRVALPRQLNDGQYNLFQCRNGLFQFIQFRGSYLRASAIPSRRRAETRKESSRRPKRRLPAWILPRKGANRARPKCVPNLARISSMRLSRIACVEIASVRSSCRSMIAIQTSQRERPITIRCAECPMG